MLLDQTATRVSTIVKVKDKEQWYIKSEPGKKYNSRAKAEKRLADIHKFEHMDPKKKKKGKKRKSFVVIASRIAGADIYERLVELDNAIEKAEGEDNEEALERLRYERASVMDAIEYEEETT